MNNEYTRHNKVVYSIQYHIIWCPKYRRGILVNSLKNRLHQIIQEVCGELGAKIKALEIMPDHVHLFISYTYQQPVYKLIKQLKGRSSNLLRTEFPELRKMPTLWTRSFFVSSVGNASEKTIQEYIENQWNK
jgi:putative transposase